MCPDTCPLLIWSVEGITGPQWSSPGIAEPGGCFKKLAASNGTSSSRRLRNFSYMVRAVPSLLVADRPDALLEGQGGGELGYGPRANQQGLCRVGGEKCLDPWGSGLPDQQGH